METKEKTACMFPGQGSQRKGMGEGLFEKFLDQVKAADEILGYSLKDLCLSDPEEKLGLTQFTQPAMYAVNVLSYLARLNEGGERPDYVIGHSLGEYSALCVAGVFSFEDGLKLVQKRGELMSKAREGAMAAVLNTPAEEIRRIIDGVGLTEIDIANYNSKTQIIISGLKKDLDEAVTVFEKENVRVVPLNTSGAFHSRYMEPCANEFKEFLADFTLGTPEIPVIANVTGKPYEEGAVGDNLHRQIFNSVRWSDSIQYLLENGVSDFVESGTGDVLTKLVFRISNDWNATVEAQAALKGEAEENRERCADSTGVEESNAPEAKPSSDRKNVKKTKKSSRKERQARQAADDGLSVASGGKAPGKGDPVRDRKGDEPKNVETDAPNAQDSQRLNKNETVDGRTLVGEWNSVHPVGTKVRTKLYDEVLETRTEAVLLFGFRAAVYLKGYNGYFDLREIEAVG